jgi:hypothetical protein
MKLKDIPKASAKRAEVALIKLREASQARTREDEFKEVARNFIEYIVGPAIVESSGTCVNIPVPMPAYRNLEGFCRTCRPMLKGYKVSISHDGGGQYNTLCVSWE